MKTPVMSAGQKIGEVVIEYNAFKINHDMSKSMIVISFYQLALLLCVAFVMMLLFRRNITNPVLSINRAIEKITSGDLSTPVPDIGENEIGVIAKGVVFLEERLSMIIGKLNSTAVNVSMATKQVDQTYTNVIEGITTQVNSVNEHNQVY